MSDTMTVDELRTLHALLGRLRSITEVEPLYEHTDPVLRAIHESIDEEDVNDLMVEIEASLGVLVLWNVIPVLGSQKCGWPSCQREAIQGGFCEVFGSRCPSCLLHAGCEQNTDPDPL